MPGGGARGKNLELLKLLYFKFFRSSHLDNHWSESFDTWTKGNLENPMASDQKVHALGVGLKVKI